MVVGVVVVMVVVVQWCKDVRRHDMRVRASECAWGARGDEKIFMTRRTGLSNQCARIGQETNPTQCITRGRRIQQNVRKEETERTFEEWSLDIWIRKKKKGEKKEAPAKQCQTPRQCENTSPAWT